MTYLKNLGKSLLLTLVLLVLSALLLTLLYHFNIVSAKIYNIFKLALPLLFVFIGAVQFGKTANKRGWLEGMKLGAIVILLFLIFSSFIYQSSFNPKMMLYFLLLLLDSFLGGMIGINKKSE